MYPRNSGASRRFKRHPVDDCCNATTLRSMRPKQSVFTEARSTRRRGDRGGLCALNDAGQWRAATDNQMQTCTLPARPLHQPGSAPLATCYAVSSSKITCRFTTATTPATAVRVHRLVSPRVALYIRAGLACKVATRTRVVRGTDRIKGSERAPDDSRLRHDLSVPA